MTLFKTKDYSKPGPAKTVYEGGQKLSKPKTLKTLEIPSY